LGGVARWNGYGSGEKHRQRSNLDPIPGSPGFTQVLAFDPQNTNILYASGSPLSPPASRQTKLNPEEIR